ncbi:MAG: Adenylate cyclase 1 [Spirochaetes bacterium ADurb.Bin269]|nr:MAG: Adenylate cyclase 1 [Spirochaetes bacterium ADurb.Bin269]
MTAIFTDIQGFSTISEKMEPVELVAMLNRYLTGMSDRVLELGGTIDKYEGDAIIAFFGAPLDVPDHAERALHAAIRMKRMEKELNQQFLTEGIVPSPLLTRIGINTGRMVVGNMGTEKKMDYTIIGDAVNLAARLEGVNKRYGTYLCVSEDTKNAAGDGFQYRRLDRIRVVGKAVPIRIFEVLEEKGQLDEQTLAALEEFDTGIELFEQRKWAKAKQAFKKVLERKPGDGPSMRFIATCNEYIANPPPENWDGVYKMDQK